MDAELYKKVIKDAIAGEVDAKEFYLKVSERIKDSYLKELFLEFSKEEENHEKILTALLEKGGIKPHFFGGKSKEYKISETIDMPEVTSEMNLKDAIGLAMKNEEIAMKKYRALADDCQDLALKGVFNSLADMEKDHKFKMENAFIEVAYPEVW